MMTLTMKATDAIILFDSAHGQYAEHYDIINGELTNAKPVIKDFFIKLKSNNDISYQEIPHNVVAISNVSFMFIIDEQEIEIQFAVNNNTITRKVFMPKLLFEVNRIEPFIKVYMVHNNELYFPYLPNIDTAYKVCTGTYDNNNLIYDKNMGKAIKEVVSMFFNTRFSNHYRPDIFDNIIKKTKNNIHFIPKNYFNEKTKYKGYNPFRFKNR